MGTVITDPQPVTRRLAITLVTAAMRGDAGTIKALLRAADPDEFAELVHCTLTLVRSLAGQLLTPRGLLAADLWLAEAARGHPCAETGLGAELVLAHAQTEFDDMVEIAVGEYNRVCCEADEEFEEVLTAGLLCWRSLLNMAATAAAPCMIGNTAAELWGHRRAKPVPPKLEETGGIVKHQTNTDPPGPTLAAPPETMVLHRPYRPYQAYLPAGAPVSLRGLAIRRQQERGIDPVYG